MPTVTGTASDDVITLDRAAPEPTIVTTGAGRDTVRILPAAASGAAVTITDFTPGDAGDILDLRALLGQPGFALYELGGGNPFARGTFHLVQNGSAVDVYFFAFGAPLIPGELALLHLLGTRLDDLTAANFAGFDPHVVSVTETRLIVADTVIAAGEVIAVERPDIFPVAGPSQPGRAVFVAEVAAATFVNHGSITGSLGSTLGSPVDPGDCLDLAGFVVADMAHREVTARFVNAADGSFVVDNRMVGDAVLTSGLYRGDGVIDLVNDGTFIVSAAAGTAQGALNSGAFANNGLFSVTGADRSVGLQGNLGFDNAGLFFVSGTTAAIGVAAAWLQATNSGTITVTTPSWSPVASIAFRVGNGEIAGEDVPHVNQLFNSGTISADIAYATSDDGGFVADAADEIVNFGTIDGVIATGFGDDVVENGGTLTGLTLLGEGDDLYLGADGRHDGIVAGGGGADVLVGGAFVDYLYGDMGDDRLLGGDGDDLIDGGFGRDWLDGGAGRDTLSFFQSLLPVEIDLAEGRASDGIDEDGIAGFELVLGSRFADYIAGAAADETLNGNDGDDRIEGGAGDDVLDGGHGDDDLAGGPGHDRFLHSIGDGIDLIRDFAAGDQLSIFGFSGARSVIQDGGAVRILLGAGEEIRLLATTVAEVEAATTYTAQPLADLPPTFDRTIVSRGDFFLPSGTVIQLDHPLAPEAPDDRFEGVGLVIAQGTFFNAGQFGLASAGGAGAGAGVAVAVDGDHRAASAGLDGRSDAALVNLASGGIDLASPVDAYGARHLDQVFSLGLIRVTSDASAWGVFDIAQLVNNGGTIDVRALGRAVGIGHDGAPDSTINVFNSGLIRIAGGAPGAGIDYASSVAGDPGAVVNAGTIVVTDLTSARDSAGVLVAAHDDIAIWNSGTIAGDYAIKAERDDPANVGAIALYNLGLLDGDVDLRRAALGAAGVTIVNRGTILGAVTLGGGDDRFDSRDGPFAGPVAGGAGNDQLLTGDGAQTLDGGEGDDLLSGGAGSDRLTGGVGADRFRYEIGFGLDTITDFNPLQGDRIDVRGYLAWSSITQIGASVVIAFDAANQIVLRNQQLANIHASDFLFGAAALAPSIVPAPPLAPATPAPPLLRRFGGDGPDTLVGGGDGEALFAGGGDDILTGGAGRDQLSGGAGNDLFRDSAAGLDGDTITDFAIGERIVIGDAQPGSFHFALDGAILGFSGGSLTLANVRSHHLVARAATAGGVELTLVSDLANDFNGDGVADILWRHDNGTVTNWLGQPGGGFVGNYAAGVVALPAGWHVLATGDYDGDGRSDVLWRHDNGTVTDWLARADGSFQGNYANAAYGIDAGWRFAGSGDFDGDGRGDVLWRDGGGTLAVWAGQLNGGFAGRLLAYQPGPQWHVAGTGDFNGDGRADILWRHDDGTVTDWLGRADGDFVGNYVAGVLVLGNEWHVAGTGDFNGDGRDDLLWRGTTGVLTDWLARPDGSFADNTASAAYSIDHQWQVALTGDVNGDGRDDIVWRDGAGTIFDWLAAPDGGFSTVMTAAIPITTAWHVNPDYLLGG